MTTIGVIGAMQNEIEKLIDKYDLKKDKINKDIYVNTFNDKSIVVAMSGVGKVNSAAMTQYIIDNYEVDAIINSGVAGGINNNIKVMDIIISDYVTYHDFEPISIMESYVPNKGKIKANTILVSLAQKVIKDMKYEIKEEKIDGDNAVVTAQITVYDYYNAEKEANTYLTNNPDKFKTDDVYDESLFTDYKLEQLDKVTDTVDYTIDFTLTKVDNEWVVNDLTNEQLEKIHGVYAY